MIGVQLNYLGSPVKHNSDELYYFENEIAIPALTIHGGMQAECDIPLPLMSVSGAFASDGSIPIPVMTISGKMRDVMDGTLRLYAVSVAGEIGVSAVINGSVKIPLVSVSGDMQAEGSIIIAAMRIAGQITQYGVITGNIALPILGIAGATTVAQSVSGSLSFPAISIFGVMVQSGMVELSGDVSLPQVRVLGSMSTYQDHSFGSETDSVLRYSATRRRI